ncbi:hypothetical protein QYE76_013294 [Lolium multiflorum]|uniref:Protein NRT1/ PTR FAMILY 3.1 n=1 Tax=Lolium multiflorum TaxID=4521 RepID=A0AAD8U2N5_LOLMU|nr:hypothetical protein QYE76_013294 [Lolium multiflorum]
MHAAQSTTDSDPQTTAAATILHAPHFDRTICGSRFVREGRDPREVGDKGMPTARDSDSHVTFLAQEEADWEAKMNHLTGSTCLLYIRRRRVHLTGMLYQDKGLDALISTNGRLLHTNHLTFFDRAAIVTHADTAGSGKLDMWRLSTVHRVEELKSLIRMLPIWSAGILLVTAGSHNNSFAIMQARTMDRHMTQHFQIPPATMSIFSTVAMLVTLVLYDRAFVPIARRFTGLPSGINYFQRMAVGLAISILGVASAALVEAKRRGCAADHGLLDTPATMVPMSVFWLVPQYAIHGVADGFSSVAHMEFLYDQAPESMRSTAAALFWLSASLGSYMGTVLVTVVQSATRRSGDWLQDNINRGKLDAYYWLVTCLMLLNLGYYLICFRFYTMKPLEMAVDDDHEKELELSSVHKNGGGGAV